VRVVEVVAFFSDERTRKAIRWCVLAVAGLSIFFFDDLRDVVVTNTSRPSVSQDVPKLKDKQ